MSDAPKRVTADRAREAWRSIVDDAEILNETPRHKDTSIILAYIAQSEAENARLREALEEMRRSDGRGGFLNCWCDSEYGPYPKPHAPYCIAARRALGDE